MTHPVIHPVPSPSTPRFRSTAAFALRSRRTGPVVERATFVLCSAGVHRCAIPVELIDRVLRHDSPMDAVDRVLRPDAHRDRTSIQHAGRALPLVDLTGALSAPVPDAPAPHAPPASAALDGAASARARLLVVMLSGGWVALRVDAVHDVASLDASLILTLGAAPATVPLPRGARATFVRDGFDYVVLDLVRALAPMVHP